MPAVAGFFVSGSVFDRDYNFIGQYEFIIVIIIIIIFCTFAFSYSSFVVVFSFSIRLSGHVGGHSCLTATSAQNGVKIQPLTAKTNFNKNK